MKRIIAIISCIAALAVTVLIASSCGESAPEKTLTGYFEALHDLDADGIGRYTEDGETGTVDFSVLKDRAELAKKILYVSFTVIDDGIDDASAVDIDETTVRTSISYIDYSTLFGRINGEIAVSVEDRLPKVAGCAVICARSVIPLILRAGAGAGLTYYGDDTLCGKFACLGDDIRTTCSDAGNSTASVYGRDLSVGRSPLDFGFDRCVCRVVSYCKSLCLAYREGISSGRDGDTLKSDVRGNFRFLFTRDECDCSYCCNSKK